MESFLRRMKGTTHCSGRGDSGALWLIGSVRGLGQLCPRR